MKTLSLIEMESLYGGSEKKCRIGVSIGCGFVGLAFGLALGPFAGFAASTICSTSASASGYCEY